MVTAEDEPDVNITLEDNSEDSQVLMDEEMADRDLTSPTL